MAQDSMIAWKRNRKPLGFGSEEKAVEAGGRTRAQEGFKKAAGPLWAVVFTLSLVLLAACLFASYCRWAWWDTHEVMQDIWEVMQGEPVSYSESLNSDDLLVRHFSPYINPSSGEVVTSIAVDRAFTWVWGNKGRIWLCIGQGSLGPDRQNYPDLTNLDVLEIEKIEGKWRVVGIEARP